MNLKMYLQRSGRTQTELARALGVTAPLVWQWLNGYRRVGASQVLKIERATDGAVQRHELRPDLYPPEEHLAA